MTDVQPTLDSRLEDLLGVPSFAPPAEFAERAAPTEPDIDDAALDAVAWWSEQARLDGRSVEPAQPAVRFSDLRLTSPE